MKNKKNICILASGNGTTLQAVIDAIESGVLDLNIVIVISDNKECHALERAKKYCIYTYVLKGKNTNERDEELCDVLQSFKVDLILLLGYLKIIGPKTINKYTIINTHPSLIPKYSGKNMYGMNVHNAVYKNKESETGVTIHFVNEKYDEGMIIWQSHVPVFGSDTPEDISTRVQMVEKTQIIWMLKAFCEGKINYER